MAVKLKSTLKPKVNQYMGTGKMYCTITVHIKLVCSWLASFLLILEIFWVF